MESATLPAEVEPLTSTQRLTFLSLVVPWLVEVVITALRPDFLHLFLRTPSGFATLGGCALLTAAQAWLLRRAYRRINRARRSQGGHSTAVLMVFATAVLGAIELLVVVFAPVAWAFLVSPGAR